MNGLKTALLMGVLTAILWIGGLLLGGRGGATIALVLALGMNFFAYWFSDRIVLAMYRAKRIEEGEAPDLFSIVRQLATRAKMPMLKVYMIDSPTPNAFATGRNQNHAAVAVTTGIMKILNRDELTGVLAHELSHVRNRDILVGTIAAALAGAISHLAYMGQWALFFGGFGGRDDRDNRGGGISALLMIVLAPIAAMLVQMAISRSREYGADEGGAKLANPLHLADALKKLETANRQIPMTSANPATAHMFIVSPLRGESVASLFSTHPPIEERIRRLEVMAGVRRG